MGKICKRLKERDVGSIGIGAMIVFIAMVLVAGIAASVLIQTSTKLETQAMKSGAETVAEVSTGIAVEGVEGHQATATTGSLDLLAIEVRPRAGSADIDLAQTVIELSDSSTKNYLTYSSAAAHFTDTEFIDGEVFTYANFTNDTTQFCVIILEDADSSASQSNPVINRGDHVILGINVSQCFGGIGTRKDIFGMVITEDGAPGIIEFTTPASFTEIVIELQ